MQSFISNYKADGTNYVYTCAEGTPVFTNSYHPLRNNVTKVKRHVLFPRSRYWVICDEFGAQNNSTFMLRWHIPWAFRNGNGTALTNEMEFTLGLFGSNSLQMLGQTGFTYTAGNYSGGKFPTNNPPRVPIHVMFAQTNGQIGFFNASGVTDLLNGGIFRNGTSSTNSTLNPFVSGGRTYSTYNPDRAVGMWITNTTPSTNFMFVWAIIPQENGKAAPIVQRLDNSTLVVTYDGVTDTNTFGTNFSGPFTYRVETTVAP